jgi:ComF family protein
MSEHINYYDLPMRYIDYIVPVPLHKSRLREREFNQAALLARHIADDLNITALEGLLKRHRPTRAQVDLERSDRLENVKGSFCVEPKHDLRGKNILLIDDVLTTGATSSEAASALKAAGAGIVFVLTLAN